MQLSFKNGKSRSRRRSLADLHKNETASISCLELPVDMSQRLMELGFVPGHEVAAVHSAPGGDPRVFRIDGAEIALRRETARHIFLQPPGALVQ
jgi:Fe2+ transport system protein FeoA